MLKMRILTGLFMGTMMSVLMSAFITAVNTGLGEGYVGRWLTALTAAWFVAVPVAILVGPSARRLAEWVHRRTGG